MRKLLFGVMAVTILGGGSFVVYNRSAGGSRPDASPAGSQAPPRAGRSDGPGGFGGTGGGFSGAQGPRTVEVVAVSRAPVAEYVTVVGNLIGAATVQVVPKVNGRLQAISVRLGDRVSRAQELAKVEDREVLEQVKQAEASFEVARATVRQRDADLKFAETSLERARNLYNRELMPRQSLDDADARYQAAAAQLDLARAQFSQAQARLDELRITMANTVIVSPVDGFVSKRFLDPGAYASPSQPVVSVVDIAFVRLVANLVEKDMKRVPPGVPASVEVDAYPGERFDGTVSRVAPVFDPATRTAEMEIEVPNHDFRLKPGMYARVRLTVGERPNALVVPRNALVDLEGRRGVFVPDGDVARFVPVEVGIQDQQRVEILGGLDERAAVIGTGATALRDGDRIVRADQGAPANGTPAMGDGEGQPRPGGPSAGPGGGSAPGSQPGASLRGQRPRQSP